MSTRAVVGPESLVVVGFSVKAELGLFLLRAVGPSLQSKVSEECLMDPVLTLRRGKDIIEINDNWSDSPSNFSLEELRSIEKRVAALPLEEGSKDSVIVIGLPKGGYTLTVEASSKNPNFPQKGLVLIEVYDLSF